MTTFAGIYPIAVTPFHEDGTIDLESQRRLARFLIDAGAHGIGLFGNASEGYTLAEPERRQLLQEIVDEVDGRVPLVVSSGHTGTDVAVAMSRDVEAMGAAALMVLPPYYLKPDGEGLFHYFRAISDAVSIPLMIQDAPLLTQVPMAAELLARMGHELERVRMVKVEAPPTPAKVSRLRELAGDDLALFGGLNGNFLLEELARGAVGTMPGSDMVDAFVRMLRLWDAGDTKGARDLFTLHLPLIRYELQPGLGVAVMKHNLQRAGIITSARVRHPTRSLSAVDRHEVDQLCASLDLLAFRWSGVRA